MSTESTTDDPVAAAISANLTRSDSHRAVPLIIGIDPGASGAMVLLDPETRDLWRWQDMPTVESATGRRLVSAPMVAETLCAWRSLAEATGRRVVAIVEEVGAMPGQGVSSMFSFGRSFGVLLGALAALSIPVEMARPATWKRKAGIGADKGAARRTAQERFPHRAELFARVRDDGRAEAALLALWRGEGRE